MGEVWIEHQDALTDAIAEHVSDAQGHMVLGWMVIAELLDEDGVRYLAYRDSDLAPWQKLGYLHDALLMEERRSAEYDVDPYDDGDA